MNNGAGQGGAGACGTGLARRGFSIIDLLVSLAVMAVLISLLLPSLAVAREAANRVRCAQNMRQFSMALNMYAMDSGDVLPNSVFNDPAKGAPEPQNTIFVHLHLHERAPGRTWDGIGKLFALEYLVRPEVYYCPSHTGLHTIERYADQWQNPVGIISSNYQFRVLLDKKYSSLLDPWTAIISDGLRTPTDYNHGDGNNMLRWDTGVQWVRAEELPIDFSEVSGLAVEQPQDSNTVSATWSAMDRLGSGGGSEVIPDP